MVNEETISEVGKYRIGTVAKLTGLSADVVRVWERRYGAIRPARSEAGTRLYSDAEVSRLRRLRQAVEKGHNIGQAAKLSEAELDQLISDSQDTAEAADPYAMVRERFLKAIERMDVVTADLELSRAATLFPARPLIKELISPILGEVGARWAHKEIGIAQEHVASNLMRNLLSSLFRLYPPTDHAETIVLATPANERHEFGLLLAALIAATRGWRVVYLGADLPASEIAVALRLTNSRFLALSVIAERPGLEAELEAIATHLPPGTRVWVGGGEAVTHRELIHRLNWILVRDLDDLDDRLRR
ncbi:MAG TPA: MerR family transcriptional regulator [Blastocatellia bacterium]|jgi:DNA-binding transcriptional MerR regulator|nr:MerR family transcriptional regulator [Blastocatellia bacterium]